MIKKCKVCKKTFNAVTSLNVYCSYECSNRNSKKKSKKNYSLKKSKDLSKLKKEADRLWRTVEKKNAVCAVCAKYPELKVHYTQLHAHHIVGRKNMTLRWDLRNRIWLCPTHHTLGKISAHNTPRWFNEEFFKTIRPIDYDYLKIKETVITKVTQLFLEIKIEELIKHDTNVMVEED